jgi:penicillin-binding protein 1B
LPSKSKKKKKSGGRRYSSRRLKIALVLLSAMSLATFALAAFLVYHTLRFGALIDLKLRGERSERPTWVYARPFEIRKGQRLSATELVGLLNDLGYREDGKLELEGTFRVAGASVEVRRRGRFSAPVAVSFQDPWVRELRTLRGGQTLDRVPFEAVPVATLFGDDRAKRRWVELEEVPGHVVDAVLATEDRRFYSHTGLDPVGIARALLADLKRGELEQGASTLTQQLVKNYFLTPEKTVQRKVLEAYLAVILESRTSKPDILELYLNEVYLGQRGSFGIQGLGQAAQIYFGKDIRNVTVAEGALLAGIIRSPNSASPFSHPDVALSRRNSVIDQMVEARSLTNEKAREAKAAPLGVASGTVDQGEAPHFIDALRTDLLGSYGAGLPSRDLRVFSTMDRHLQSAAQSALAEGLGEIHGRLSAPPQAALVALSPSTGDVLALVGARSYGESQFNRATEARRQPGSAFKPFVYLAAFENDPALGPATTVVDEPTTFRQGRSTWTPSNYTGRFEGKVTYRRALSLSLNVATARVGERVGFENVVALWESMGTSSRIEPYPSLVLGSFEVTPLELAAAYAVLASGGKNVRPRFYTSIEDDSGRVLVERGSDSSRVASAEGTYLVTDMLESVVDAGTAREIRARGLRARVAGKTGTTNDTRDAWFVGYTPDVLAVVWVGYDDNRPLGLSGSEAALPIWTRFMKAALEGREKVGFTAPAGVAVVELDPATGRRAKSSCPRKVREVFRTSSAPRELCNLH